MSHMNEMNEEIVTKWRLGGSSKDAYILQISFTDDEFINSFLVSNDKQSIFIGTNLGGEFFLGEKFNYENYDNKCNKKYFAFIIAGCHYKDFDSTGAPVTKDSTNIKTLALYAQFVE